METLDPIAHDVVECRVADSVPGASPVDAGEYPGAGRLAPASFRYRRRVGTQRRPGSLTVARFELSAHQCIYAFAPSAPLRARDACRKRLLVSFELLQNKQREVIWQLRLDASL